MHDYAACLPDSWDNLPPPKKNPNKTTPTCNADKDIKQNRRFWRLKTLFNFPNVLSDITIMAYF